MKRLIRGLLAAVVIAPLTTVAVVSATGTATAEDNGVGQTPALGWSSWSFVRHNPTAATIEAQADAMKSSGLASIGYQYVNIDDFWYQCPGSQGPNVDQYGRWVTDATKFPASGSENGIQVVADYVHKQGLKFGIYVTPGISKQAVAENTPIEGTPYHADDIATTTGEGNYNCGGMVGIDYSKPGAQAFINSWADEFASWGIDYIKIDGVGTQDIPDVQAWSAALKQTGRPIHVELSNNLDINNAATWAKYSNGWRTGGDIECYCGPNGSSYPLTGWSSVDSRFDQVAAWQPYGGPGAFNDYDSIEVGNGTNDGLTPDERQTQLSLWALASSPLILGTDLTHLDPTDLGYLKNKDVLAVDQDSTDASRVSNSAGLQVFAKTERNGDAIVGLFNTTTAARVVATTPTAVGLTLGSDYLLNNLWTHQTTESGGVIAADVPPHGVALYRVTKTHSATKAAPATTIGIDGPTAVTAGQPATYTVTLADEGPRALTGGNVQLSAPSGWTVTGTPATGKVAAGGVLQTTYQVTAPPPTQLLGTSQLTATATYTPPGGKSQQLSISDPVTTATPVQAPYLTYSSAGDAPALFAQSGQQFAISGAGPDLWTGSDSYSTIYQPGVVGNTSTIETEITNEQDMTGYAKAGIIVRNSMNTSGSSPEGIILMESPGNGIDMAWTSTGGTHIDTETPPDGTIAFRLPLYLKLVRSGSTYTGYYSTDNTTWTEIASVSVPGQAATQDAGMFMISHAAGSPGTCWFNGFSVS